MSLAAPTPAVTDFGALGALKSQARAQDPDSVRAAAQQFEALFVQEVLKSARNANLGEDLFGGGQGDLYRDLFDQQMALHLSTAGGGLGLAEVLVRQMLQEQNAAQAGDGAGGGVPAWNPLPARGSTSLRIAVPGEHSGERGAVAQTGAAARAAASPSRVPDSPNAFIAEIRPHAEAAAETLGVPAEAIMAQAALETGWGQFVPRHADGRSSFNYFGIKTHGRWDGERLVKTTHEHLGGRMQKVSAEFRAYESPAQAFEDYARFLQSNPRYTEALRRGQDDAQAYARGLQNAGYATDPAYANKLLKLIDRVSITTAAPSVADGPSV